MISCESISDIKENVINLLKSNFAQFEIINEFSKNQFFGICDKNIICVKFKEINISDLGFDNYLDYNNDQYSAVHTYGKNASISFEILVYTKINSDIDLSEIFLQICSVLSSNNEVAFNNFSFSKTEFIEQLQSFCTKINTKCTAIVTSITQDKLISDIVISYKK